MKPHHLCHRNYHRITLFLTLSFIASATATIHGLIGAESNPRRILHEPLFPVSSTPPPEDESPPPPDSSVFPNPNQPFLPESPSGPTPDQVQPAPPSPLFPANGTAVANTIASQSSKPAKKKVAIAISVGIVTLGMLSALAFYLYKHGAKHSGESQKLVGENSQRFRDESRMPPSTLLYIGTVEPLSRSSVGETNAASVSPYRKLSSSKRSDRYRPSPDLQPLPPLSKPPLPALNSPPPMSSSDEESHETAFYTPQGSSVSNEEGSYAHGSRSSHPGNSNGLVTKAGAENHAKNGAHHPYSKRTSPRSRLSASSIDTKQTIIPSIKEPRLPSPPKQPTEALPSQAEGQESRFRQSPPSSNNSNSPRRLKFPSLPPAPNLAPLQVVNSQPMHASKIPVPPPPPPPPPARPRPPPSAPRKLGGLETRICSVSSQGLGKPQQSEILDSNANSRVEKIRMAEEANKGGSSLERTDAVDIEGLKPKLKPLHWDKVRATSDRVTVWDQLKSSSFQLNEDMMETLFGCNSTNSVPKETTRKSVLPPVERENRVLDPKKSQNIAILLRALNVTQDEVTRALIDGNPDSLGAELLETLVKMAPTKEEEIKLRDYKSDILKLGSAERFLKAVLDMPHAFKRVEAMLYRANFDTEVKYLRKSFETLEAASGELKNSPLFLKLLEAVLRTGNRMNVGTNRGDAKAFKLDTLLKLVDIKGTDGKTTLLHFVVQEIVRSEAEASDPTAERLSNQINSKLEEDFRKQGLQVVAGLSRELGNVKLAAGMDSDVLSSYVSKLEMGLEKIKVDLQFQKQDAQGKFLESMEMFLKKAEEEIACIKSDERKVLSSVKEVTEYFHDNAAREEAHPFRIFMIVRDFLSILDRVCKDVGKMNDSVMVGSARSFRIAATASLPGLNRYNVREVSSDEESSMLRTYVNMMR